MTRCDLSTCARTAFVTVWHPENDEEMLVCDHHSEIIVDGLGGEVIEVIEA